MPSYVNDRTIPLGLRAAAIDAFFIHLRLLIEFLIKSRDDRAIRRHDYAKGFHLNNPGLRNRLAAGYEFASREVAHFNYERVPAEDSPPGKPVDSAGLHRHADDVFAAMGAFTRHLANTGNEYAADFSGWLATAQGRRQWQPPG